MYVHMLNKTNITHLQLTFPSLTVQPTGRYKQQPVSVTWVHIIYGNSKNYDTSKINLYHHVQYYLIVGIDMKI